MKKDKLKKVLSIALSVAMVIGTVSFLPQSTWEAYADTATVKNINLGTRGFSAPTSTGSDATSWEGSKVYFGVDTSSTIPRVNSDNSIADKSGYTKTTANNLWRVLDASSGLLFADDIIAKRRYDDSSSYVWNDTNELYNWLNGATYKTNSNKFSTIEQGAIATNIDGDMRLLTIEEVKKTEYGFTDDKNENAARAASAWWWLRSPGNRDNDVAAVGADGFVYSSGYLVSLDDGSVRPAFNLNLDSVLFSSASTASKFSFASVGEDKVNTNTWKLTLKDSSKTVNVTSGASVTQSGQTVTVPYTYTGDDVSQLSIMITDKAYTESDASILYYGALNTNLATTGKGTFTLPSSLPDGYKIYMMAEDVNDENLTDYSSTPVEIIPVPAKPAAPTPRLNLHVKAGATKVTLSWNKVKGADGYYIYGNKCGPNSVKKIKTIKKSDTLTWTQKNLKKGKTYNYKIQAYKKTANGTKILKTSVMVHEALTGSKYTNAKKVTANFTTATLKKGKTKQIKAKIIKQNPKKKLVSHTDKFRYRTNNSKVATVSKSGKIKAVGKGKCNIYVYANNGVYKKLTITVK